MPKFVFVGNCQARPLATLVGQAPGLQMSDPVIVHLAKNSQEEEHLRLFDDADLIVSQYVSPTFNIRHLSTDSLKNRYSNKVLVVPNIYYSGQNVGLSYIGTPTLPRLKGPLAEYHLYGIFKSWLLGLSVVDAVQCLWAWLTTDIFENVHNYSIQDLRNKESHCDIFISDFIDKNRSHSRLFWTFNHPSNLLLSELAKRIMIFNSIDVSLCSSGREYLDMIVPPTSSDSHGDIFGLECEIDLHGVTTGRRRSYGLIELVETFYAAYDVQCERNIDIEMYRFSPNYLLGA